MDTPTASNRLQSSSEDDSDKFSIGHSKFNESSFDDILRSPATASDKDTFNSPSTKLPQKKKCVLELFPWLNEIEKTTQKCLGSVTEVKNKTVLNAMDFLIRYIFAIYFDHNTQLRCFFP